MGKQKKGLQPTTRSWSVRGLWPILVVAVAAAAVYCNTFPNEFLFDDFETIVEARSLGRWGPLTPLFDLLRGNPAYRPIRSASYAFDYALSGFDPWGYHLTNIVYHVLSAVVVFLIAERLFDRINAALFAGLLFAVHPIQTEAVAYLSGRRDVLSGLFVLLGFYLFLQYRKTSCVRYLVMVLVLYPLAFLSKESGIILPLLCLSYDVIDRIWTKKPGAVGLPSLREIGAGVISAIREARLLYLPIVVLTAGMAVYVLFFVRGTWVRDYHGGSVWFTGLTMARVFLHYIKLLLFPVTLNADYSFNAFPVTTSWADASAWTAVLILTALGVGLLCLLRTRPLAVFGGLWFFVALLPVSQIIPHHEMMAEHFLYIPTVGFCLLVGGLLDPMFADPRSVRVLYGTAGLVLVLLSFRTMVRNTDWRDELTLWRATVQTAPQSARARNNLGAAYLNLGQPAAAREQLEAAVQIKPDLAVAYANLGKIALDHGDLAQAEQALRTAVRLKENEVIPRLWLGAVLMRMGRILEAEQQFQAGLAKPPYDAYAQNNLGILFAEGGRMTEAEAAFRAALRRMPGLTEAQRNLTRLSRLREGGGPAIGSVGGGRP